MDDGACKCSLMSLMTDIFDSIIRTYFTVNSDDLVFHLEERHRQHLFWVHSFLPGTVLGIYILYLTEILWLFQQQFCQSQGVPCTSLWIWVYLSKMSPYEHSIALEQLLGLQDAFVQPEKFCFRTSIIGSIFQVS